MKVTLNCSPFEGYPGKIFEGLIRAIKAAGDNHGVPLEIFPDLSCRDAEMRFAEWMHLAHERRQEGE